MHENILYIIGLSTVVATVLAYVSRMFRQPLLLAYIAAGLILGPQVLGWIAEYEDIAILSELGLAFLLFMVGLEIDVMKLIKLGKISFVTGIVQLGLSVLAGLVFVRYLGYDGLPGIYLAVGLAFSSTMIVVKLLSDKAELDTIHGRITLSILLIQDAVAIIVLALQTNLKDPSVLSIVASLLSGLGLAAGSALVARYILPPLFRYAARSPEVLFISSLSWCFIVCGLALALKFSIAMGALIAGVSISSSPYSLDIIAKIRSLRDFFVTLFFISLGMQINISSGTGLANALMLSGLIVVTRWLTVLPTLYFLKFGTRVGILSSMNLAQASEFSLVIAALGFRLNHIDDEIVSQIAIALVITSTVSTYMIAANHRITKRLVKLLSAVGLRDQPWLEDETSGEKVYDIILLGCHRVAGSLLPSLSQSANRYLVVDFNPEVLEKLRQMNVPTAYADISHIESLGHLGINTARIIISSISDDFLRGIDNLKLVQMLRKLNPDACIISNAETIEKAKQMYHEGASYVFVSRHLAADHLVKVMQKALDGDITALRKSHLGTIEGRFEIF